jgi:hypothetical protein
VDNSSSQRRQLARGSNMVQMYDKKQSETIVFDKLLKTKIPVNNLFTGI